MLPARAGRIGLPRADGTPRIRHLGIYIHGYTNGDEGNDARVAWCTRRNDEEETLVNLQRKSLPILATPIGVRRGERERRRRKTQTRHMRVPHDDDEESTDEGDGELAPERRRAGAM